MGNLHVIPIELKARKQWVCWRSEIRNGEKTKLPYQTNGKLASSTEPATWNTFQNVVKAKGFDGIGFVLKYPFCGIDLDHHRNPETGEIDAFAQTVISELNSYTEISPSGAGLHIILQGKLLTNASRNNELNIEFYDHARYFTVTGDHLEGTPFTIEERQDKLTELHSRCFPKAESKQAGGNSARPNNLEDQELIEKAMKAANGAAFERLWNGDTSAYNNDDSAADLALCNHLAFWTGNDPARIDSLFRQSGLYREKWERQDYRERTIAKAIESTRKTYNRFGGNGNGHKDNDIGTTPKQYALTDTGNAERLVSKYGDIIRYVHERKRWLIYDCKVWEWDNADDTAMVKLAKSTARDIPHETTPTMPSDDYKAVLKWAKDSESEKRLAAMISLAKSEDGITISISDLNKDNYLFNVENGTIDLHAGTIREHDRRDLITVLVPINFDPNASCPRWLAFLELIMNKNQDKIQYLQRLLGYSMTGDTKTQVIPFCWGEGGNGKSTMLSVVRRVMGDYAMEVDPDVFMVSKGQTRDAGARETLADLYGKRFVTAIEIQENRQLSINLLKAITGGESISSDRKYEHNIRYRPTFKVWLSGNNEPVITDNSHAAWRRLKKISFPVKIEKQIDGYETTFATELSGILNWLLDGCVLWQMAGLEEPKDVTKDTEEYRQDQDVLNGFIQDSGYTIKNGLKTTKKDLRKAYVDYCEENSQNPLSERNFKTKILAYGVRDGKAGGVRYWFNIGLLTAENEKQGEFHE